MTYKTILTELVDGAIGIVTLNRPEAANALSRQMAEELVGTLHYAETQSNIRVIILTGAGKKAFCAGADLKERQGMDRQQWNAQHHAFEKAVAALMHYKKPVIAAVGGAAIGGGMELAMACDFIYASKTATFGLTEARLGIMPGMGGTQTLSRTIGARRAKEMMFLGHIFGAEEAYDIGLVNRIYAPSSLMEAAVSTALAISGNAPLSVAAIKHAVDEGADEPLAHALQTELRHYNQLLDTKDRHEGVNAFNEKRKPRFTGS
ncbi:MAG: enoyl-CoA hydratase-related protein [Alphaproteobacteria bacterium]|nr:enoyl-CoA hydratase-related protein [Alphaproteobacteria bacterium]